MTEDRYQKNMTFKRKHNHPAVKGEFHDGCEACAAILARNSTTGTSYGRGAPWRPRKTSSD